MVVYCGGGKQHPEYDLINISFCLDNYPTDLIKVDKNGKRWLNSTLSARREIDQYGNTHSLKVNEYKPRTNQDGY